MSDRGAPSDPRPDEELIEAINAGDARAFEAIYYRYRNWVFRLAHRLTGNRDDALDVLQETFTYLLGKFPGFTLRSRLTTFLYPVVKHLSIAACRERGRFRSEDDLSDLPTTLAGSGAPDLRANLAAELRNLSPAHREVVLMRFVDDMTLEEIAAALQVPLGTVKSRLHHALATLRDDPRTREYFA